MNLPSRNRPALVQLAAISWNFGWPVVAGVVVGWWVDEKLGSSPIATLTFGLGSMMTAVWRLLVLSRRDAAERREEEQHEPDPRVSLDRLRREDESYGSTNGKDSGEP